MAVFRNGKRVWVSPAPLSSSERCLIMNSSDNVPIECAVSIRIIGELLQPERVTELMQLSPSHSHCQGDANVSPSGRVLGNRSEGIWIYELPASPKCVDSNLCDLLELLKEREQVVRRLIEEGLRADLTVGLFGIEDNGGFSIKAETLAAIAALGV